jgi:uncharacterized protein YyaL (SSP411 family)
MRTPKVALLPLLAAACVSEHGPLTNRMAQSTTPYLARAAHQPVSWQQWGRDAFALAARLDRPILLYVGAEDCRWCGVMDLEVYGDPALGAMIDSLFVPVRVDRDERPDVALRYGKAVQLLAGLRGYPLTVFLTPDGAAFFGGTYFPLDDPVTGRGLKQLLPEVSRSYRDQHASILRRAALVQQLAFRPAAGRGALRSAALQHESEAVRGAVRVAIRTHAGQGSLRYAEAARLLLAAYARSHDSSYLNPALSVLDYMVDSGDATLAASARDDPPELVRAGLLRGLTAGWSVSNDPRYRDAARTLAQRLVVDLGRVTDRPTFADRDAYVIASILDAAVAVSDSATVERGCAAFDSLLRRVYAPRRPVRHVAGSGGPPGRALLQDQVQVAWTALAAHDATGEQRYLAVAQDLAGVLERDFADSGAAGYFDAAATDAAAPALAERAKPVLDDLLPGANGVAAEVLMRLARATGNARYRRRAEATLETFTSAVLGEGMQAATYLTAVQDYLRDR